MTTPKTTLPEWDALSAARRAVLDARTNVARAAFDAATKAAGATDGWEQTGYGATCGAHWRSIVEVTCHSTAWYGEVQYDGAAVGLGTPEVPSRAGEADCFGPFDTPGEALAAVAASGLDLGDFLTVHPWLRQ